MIKLHVFSGFENKWLGITTDMELGHLYSDDENLRELVQSAKRLGLKEHYLQTFETGIYHFDLWKSPLQRAKTMFPVVSDEEFTVDMRNCRAVPRCNNCRWWEFVDRCYEVGHYGSCHHPIGEAQHIAFTGETAPFGLELEGARKGCALWESVPNE